MAEEETRTSEKGIDGDVEEADWPGMAMSPGSKAWKEYGNPNDYVKVSVEMGEDGEMTIDLTTYGDLKMTRRADGQSGTRFYFRRYEPSENSED